LKLLRPRRRFIVLSISIIALLIVAYLAASKVLYRQLATVLPHCDGAFSSNTPANFSAAPYHADFDTTPYQMPNFQAVDIPSRDPGINVSSWFVPTDDATNAPAVIVIHGLGVGTTDCKHSPRSLLPAGMLHNDGYNVLLIDLRQHGDSTVTNGMWAANTTEFHDVLGAWDWLVNTQKITPQQIGLFGYSGGTGAALIAMGEESQIAAAWLDSPYTDLETVISDHLATTHLPAFLMPGGFLMARLNGVDLLAYRPLAEAVKIGKSNRPVSVVHAADDPVLPSRYAQMLVDTIQAAGGHADLWIPPGTQHVGAMFDYPEDYAKRLTAFFDAHLRQ